jgi:hypothetical protein
MQQIFRATILNGAISASKQNSALESVILQMTKRKRRNNQFVRFLLSELLECKFMPSTLAPEEFSPLLQCLTDLETLTARSVEVTAINMYGPYNPHIVATAEFSVPLKCPLRPDDWTYEMSMSPSLQDSVRFYWAWGEERRTVNGHGIDDLHHALLSDTLAFEIVPPLAI